MEGKVILGLRNDSCKTALMTKRRHNESRENSGMLETGV